MRKDFKILLVIFAIAIPFFWLKFRPQPNFYETFQKMREDGQREFDKATEPMRRRNYLMYQIDSLLQTKNYQKATHLVDSMLLANPEEYLFVDYKGQIAFNQGDIRQSIQCYTEAMLIAKHNYPKSLVNRAKAYNHLKLYDSAILDLKSASEFAFDYYRPLADVYVTIKLNDSAIKYYTMYLDKYPDTIDVAEKLSQLKNGR